MQIWTGCHYVKMLSSTNEGVCNWSGCQELSVWGLWDDPDNPESPSLSLAYLLSPHLHDCAHLSLFPDMCSRCPRGELSSVVYCVAWPAHSGMKARPSFLIFNSGHGFAPHRGSSWNHEFCCPPNSKLPRLSRGEWLMHALSPTLDLCKQCQWASNLSHWSWL